MLLEITQAPAIDLEGPWEVALTEISYPCTWFNMPNDKASLSGEKNLHLMKCPQKELNPLQKFCSGFFMDLNHLGVEVDFFSLQNR